MPLSENPESRARQLANLRRGGRGAPFRKPESALEFRLRRLTPTSKQVQAVLDELLAVQHEMARPTEADLPLLAALAQALVVQRMALADVLRYGIVGPDGRERASARLVLHAGVVVAKLADRLALGPAARHKLGLSRPANTLAEALLRLHTSPLPAATQGGAGDATGNTAQQHGTGDGGY